MHIRPFADADETDVAALWEEIFPVVADNAGVVRFHECLGYTVEPRISLGKRLIA